MSTQTEEISPNQKAKISFATIISFGTGAMGEAV